MAKKIIVIALLSALLLSLFAFAGCTRDGDDNGDNTEFSYDVAYADSFTAEDIPFDVTYADSMRGKEFGAKVDSLSRLKEVCAENGYPFFDENAEGYSSELAEKIRGYDDEYFKDGALALIFVFGAAFDAARIENVTVADSELKVVLSRPDTVYEQERETAFAYVIELDKASVADVKKISYEYVTNGKMYLMEEVYLEGGIDGDDLKSIAYYHHDGRVYDEETGFSKADYEPAPKEPEALTEEVEKQIIRTFLDYYFAVGAGHEAGIIRKNAPFDEDDFGVTAYYGTYNGYTAVRVGGDMALGTVSVRTVGDVTFLYPDSNNIIILWKQN